MPPERLLPAVVRELPHDPEAFTQGLVWHRGRLYESTGQYGVSELREIDPDAGSVLRQASLPKELFGEGLAAIDDRLVQLTWMERVALVWDLASFREIARHEYLGQGWGLCHEEGTLYMSDGSDLLVRRQADSFALIGKVSVTDEGRPLGDLNELECVGGQVWANLWMSDRIVRIDPRDGRVTASVDASALRRRLPAGQSQRIDVLNGIAYRPETDTFFVTGKLWPVLFEVRMEPVVPAPR